MTRETETDRGEPREAPAARRGAEPQPQPRPKEEPAEPRFRDWALI